MAAEINFDNLTICANLRNNIADRKVYLDIKAKVILLVPEGVEVAIVVDGLQLNSDRDSAAQVYDFEIVDHEITDSK
jgi:hypothetical protein